MSFIFDALRKSESERQRGTTPGLADVRHAGRSRRAFPWLPILGLVLLANLLLLVFIWRTTGSGEPAAVPVAAMPAPAPVVPVAVPAASPTAHSDREVRPLAREPVVRAADSVSAAASSSANEPASRFANDFVPTDTDPDTTTLPRFEELISAGRLDIPSLNLELHVWSELTASRFVFINGSRYREGERLREGPRIETITSTGLILDHNGERFVLPRQ